MSTDNRLDIQSSIADNVCLAQSLTLSEQALIATYLRLLPTDCIESSATNSVADATVTIKGMVDGRGLACPMPLLKTKVALRDISINDSLYVIATDPNSRADITAFCQQNKQANSALFLQLTVDQSTADKTNPLPTETVASASFDTIFHFIITKTDSN